MGRKLRQQYNPTTTAMSVTLWLIMVPLCLLVYVIYMFFIKIYIDAARFKKMDPELKTFIAPFSGLLKVQKKNVEKYGDSHKFIKDLVRENPNLNAYLTNLGYKPLLILNNAKYVKEVSLNAKAFRKFNLYKHSEKSYTKGIFFAEDDDWVSQKSIIRHSFNHESLKKMLPAMQDSIARFLDRKKQQIRDSPNKQVEFNVVQDNQLMIGEILVRIFFSEEAVHKQVHGMSFSLALAEFTTTMFHRSRTGQNIILQLFLGEAVTRFNFSQADKKLDELITDIRVVINQILEDRMKKEDDEDKDFIYNYLKSMREIDSQINEAESKGQPHSLRRITKEEIMHQLISFYFAGIDTTGHLIAMSLYALAEFPDHRQRIIDEIKEHIKSTDDINYENLQKLDFMGKFMDECLRMWPPAVGILLRRARRDIKIGPYEIPGGMLVGTNIIGLMHNPRYYNNPEKFDPDRWNDKSLYNTEPYSFIPFSAGNRSCIGKYLALMETKLMLIGFLTNFDISRTEVPLRLHAKFLYEPVDENLVLLKEGGIKFQQ